MQFNAYFVAALDTRHLAIVKIGTTSTWHSSRDSVNHCTGPTNISPFLFRSNFRDYPTYLLYRSFESELCWFYACRCQAVCVCAWPLFYRAVIKLGSIWTETNSNAKFYVWCDYIIREYLYAEYQRVKHTHVKYVIQNTFATPCNNQFYGVCNNDLQV